MEMQFNPITTQLDMVGGGGKIEPTEYDMGAERLEFPVLLGAEYGDLNSRMQLEYEPVPGLPLATISVAGRVGGVKKLVKKGTASIDFYGLDIIPRAALGLIGFPVFVAANTTYRVDLASHSIVGYICIVSQDNNPHVTATLTAEGAALPDDTEIWTAAQMVRVAKREAQ